MADGSGARSSRTTVDVQPAAFAERHLSVPPRFVEPPAAERPRIEREAAKLHAIYDAIDHAPARPVRRPGAPPAQLAVRITIGVQRRAARSSRRPRLREPRRRRDPRTGRRPRRAGGAAVVHGQHRGPRPRLRPLFDPGAHAADPGARGPGGGTRRTGSAPSARPGAPRAPTCTGRSASARPAWIRRRCSRSWRRRGPEWSTPSGPASDAGGGAILADCRRAPDEPGRRSRGSSSVRPDRPRRDASATST